jgi:serine/threonine protein kinase
VTTPVAPGEVLDGKYKVEHVIGTGGMGVVVAAMHLELRQRVAIKFLLAEAMAIPEVSVRFIREARAAARIRSEHVARVIDVGRLASGSPYIVMEYLEGSDLDETLGHGPLSAEDATDYVIQACDAMAEAHRLGIVHRDLKPANLFLSRQLDGSASVKVLDFGISKSVFDTGSGALTNAGALVGSPLYMSPEQMRSAKDVDLRSDIWSLGAVLFELLARRPPFVADAVPMIISAILNEPPADLQALRPDLPEGLVAAVMRCLEKDPAQRFQDVSELVLALVPYAPQRAQIAAERVHRMVGSVPPPRPSSAPPSFGSSRPPRQASGPPVSAPPGAPGSASIPPRSEVPLSLPRPPGTGALATTATAAGHGTAPGWTGAQPPRRPGPSNTLLGGLMLGALVLAAAGYLVVTSRRPVAPSEERIVTSPPSEPSTLSPAPASSPPSVTLAPVLPSAAPAAASVEPAAEAAPPSRSPRKAVAAAVPPAPAASSDAPRTSGFSMKLK